MRSYEKGPVARICKPSQVAATSKVLGLPVVSDDPDDPFHHENCGGCAGTKTSEDCPYSVRIQRYVDGLPYPPSQGVDQVATVARPQATVVPDGVTFADGSTMTAVFPAEACCQFHDHGDEPCVPDDLGGYCCDNCPALLAVATAPNAIEGGEAR